MKGPIVSINSIWVTSPMPCLPFRRRRSSKLCGSARELFRLIILDSLLSSSLRQADSFDQTAKSRIVTKGIHEGINFYSLQKPVPVLIGLFKLIERGIFF